MPRNENSQGMRILWNISGKGISKMEMAVFCCKGGRRSNSNLTDSNPENLDFHDFLIFGTLRKPLYSRIDQECIPDLSGSGKC